MRTLGALVGIVILAGVVLSGQGVDKTGTFIQVGTSLPSGCVVGSLYFKSDATPGQNLHYCTSANTWTQQLNSGTGSGSGDASTNTSSSVDSEIALFSSTTGKILKRASASGIAKLTSGVLSAVTAPSGTIVGTSDSQALTNKSYEGLTITGSTGTFTLTNAKTLAATNSLTLGGTDGSSVAFGAGGTVAYLGTAQTLSNTNTFTGRVDASGASSTAPIKAGTSLPGTCTSGKDLFFKTDATAGQNLYFCTATNTWTQQLNSGGGSGDTSTNTSSSVDSEITLFSGTGGKTLKRATGSGIVNLTSGVMSTATTITNAQLPTAESEGSITTGQTIATYNGTYGVTCGTACTVVLPTAASQTGKTLAFRMSSTSANMTLDGASTETIDGQLTKILVAGEFMSVLSDGTNWNRQIYNAIPTRCGLFHTGTQSTTVGDYVAVAVNTIIVNVGGMADTANHRCNIVRPGDYSVYGMAGLHSNSGATQLTITAIGADGDHQMASGFASVPTGSQWGSPVAGMAIGAAVGDPIYLNIYTATTSLALWQGSSFPDGSSGSYLFVVEVPK